MNFLAHIHIATVCNSDIAGNLLGDFVKGNPIGRYPKEIVDGILLHRFVDKFTDQHEISKQARVFFSPHLRRFSPIAMDLFWDHCLANDWSQYCEDDLHEFCQIAEQNAVKPNVVLPERYLHVTEMMWRNHWLASYRNIENIEFALERMSHRSDRMAPLAECFQDINAHYQPLRALFSELYHDVLKASKEKTRQLA
ncbi:acyl carrier protein phosphodiesterase [Vibrio algarum]|uniref:ACP phosphodiesterase n=1 Tax=Vibrio algarum TaxID=3020714 RepID=A0ABT4YX51_9VIBR|nr:ACP phosphodiesterase [Vibrio sp. KJ40-1]MDB1126078.1 ACP phosphodiesterase [Vibrio sp. KJ40-1]